MRKRLPIRFGSGSLSHLVIRGRVEASEMKSFYTNILGLLNQHMLDSEFSLAEVRVLYDIGHTENCTAKVLCFFSNKDNLTSLLNIDNIST